MVRDAFTPNILTPFLVQTQAIARIDDARGYEKLGAITRYCAPCFSTIADEPLSLDCLRLGLLFYHRFELLHRHASSLFADDRHFTGA